MANFSQKDIKRFWSKVEKTLTCWEWKTGLMRGYGAFSIKRKSYLAHRFSFELKNGDISNKTLDHLCRNSKCVNPSHLEIVSRGENCRRGRVAKLNMEKALSIKDLYKNRKYNQCELANIFNVGQDEISRIINNKRWATI